MFRQAQYCKTANLTRSSRVRVRRPSSRTAAVTKTGTSTGRWGHRDEHAAVISQIQDQVERTTLLSNFVLVDALRSAYPSHVLTQTPASTGLAALARSGGFEAHLDTSIDFYAGREKDTLAEQVEQSCDLDYKVELGRLNCAWRDRDFYIYKSEYWQNDWEHISNHYVLYPREYRREGEGASTFADQLIVAALQHKAKVDEEVWVFNRHWERSSKLWKSVKESTWDDVILNQELKEELIKDVTNFFDREEHYKAFGVPWKVGAFPTVVEHRISPCHSWP